MHDGARGVGAADQDVRGGIHAPRLVTAMAQIHSIVREIRADAVRVAILGQHPGPTAFMAELAQDRQCVGGIAAARSALCGRPYLTVFRGILVDL